MEGLPPLPGLTATVWYEAQRWQPPQTLAERREAQGAAARSINELAAEQAPPAAQRVSYSGAELDQLALLFTLVKVRPQRGSLGNHVLTAVVSG